MPTRRLPLNIPALLGHTAPFGGLAPGELARIATSTQELRCDKGDILFNRGEPCNGTHLIIDGQIKLALPSPQGTEKVVEILGNGQTFGEALMFSEQSYMIYAQALAPTHLLYFPKQVLFGELERDPRIARKLIASLAMRLHHLMADVESYTLRSGRQRVIGYLLREAPADKAPAEVSLSTTKATIASRLNLTQEHFSRILHDLVAAGLIQVRGRTIVIPDTTLLRMSEQIEP